MRYSLESIATPFRSALALSTCPLVQRYMLHRSLCTKRYERGFMNATKITFDDATVEINTQDHAVAAVLMQEQTATDATVAEAANKIIELYRKGVGANGETPETCEAARTEFLGRYDAWRSSHAALVAPIALENGFPPPSAPAAKPFGDLAGAFLDPSSLGTPPSETAPAATTPVFIESTPTPVKASSEPATGSKRTRRAWSQSDVVTLTRTILGAQGKGLSDSQAAAEFLAVRPDLDIETVLDKAVELELIEAPPAPKVYEMSETDKTVITKRVREQITTAKDPVVQLTCLKFAAGVLREFIKEISG